MGSPKRSHERSDMVYTERRGRERDVRRENSDERNEQLHYRADSQQNSSFPPLKRSRTDGISEQASDSFVWKKKVEQLRRKGIQYTKEDESRHREELQRELVEARRRRERRDEERAEWETQQNAVAREREAQLNEGWHRQEASFHGKQYFLRQGIRIRDGRPTRVDELARYVRLDLRSSVESLNIEELLQEMDDKDVEGLAEGVEEELDYAADFTTEGDNAMWNRALRLEFWHCVKKCVTDRLSKVQERRRSDQTGGVNHAVEEDVNALLNGKTIDKLREMETEIDSNLKSNEEGYGEVDFWTAVLARIKKSIAVERLCEISVDLKREREVRNANEREHDVQTENPTESTRTEEDDNFMHLAAKELGSDEENFADEVEVPQAVKRRQRPAMGYAWNDKHRPRKPRYFNRVYAGYNWTKYNRTHYDHDNPPPKTVQGYKFNLFYPDLIDPTKTPVFSVKKTENPDVAIITFKAGPPYEDLAFKIVNRPWERSHRRGYKCSFDRGILHLWFHFQRYRYRR